jgi:hypothetical protein
MIKRTGTIIGNEQKPAFLSQLLLASTLGRMIPFVVTVGVLLFAVHSIAKAQLLKPREKTGAKKTYDYFPREPNGDFKFPELKTECSHIRIIDGTDNTLKEKVHPDYRDLLQTPKPYQRKLVILALNELPEFVCKSVAGIAFYNPIGTEHEKKSPSVKTEFPDVINLNVAIQAIWAEGSIMPVEEFYPRDQFFYQLRVNYDSWPDAMATVIHEAGHCATLLLESQTEQKNGEIVEVPTPWPEELLARARKIIENLSYSPHGLAKKGDAVGLQRSLLGEWKRVHNSFADERLAEKYADDERPSDRTLPSGKGFLSYYAHRNVVEDITESLSVFTINNSTITSGKYADELIYHGAKGTKNAEGVKSEPELVTPFYHRDTYRAVTPTMQNWQVPCGAMQNRQEVGVPQDWAAIYTKMMFLIDLGLIDQEMYDKCAGFNDRPKLRPNYDKTENGWHRVGDVPYSHNKIYPGFPTDTSKPQIFTILGEGVLKTDDGKSYDQVMKLLFLSTKKPALPRGLYRFGFGPLQSCLKAAPFFRVLSTNEHAAFELEVAEARSKGFCATDGYVWVARSSMYFIEAKMVINKAVKHVGLFPIPEVPNIVAYIRWRRPSSPVCNNLIPCPIN